MAMKCEQFKRAYTKFDGAHDNIIHWRDTETHEYLAYSDHMQDCHTCRDWFQAEELQRWKINVAEYPCVHMAYQTNYRCATHQDPWECPVALVVYLDQYDEYGLPIRDGGSSYWKIDACPWCGVSLPESKRPYWIQKLRALGYDPMKDYDKIPVEYKTSQWYRQGNFAGLRLVEKNQ